MIILLYPENHCFENLAGSEEIGISINPSIVVIEVLRYLKPSIQIEIYY